MSNIESQVHKAIASERSENRRRDRIKATLIVFVAIPLVVVAVVVCWLAAQRMGVI
jgi:t-SNARE complex subunit (syntaxin)